jgi:hypothetical protein
MDATGSGSSPDLVGCQAALLRPLEDAVALFEELQISYAVVGGVASMIYGCSCFAEDLNCVAAVAQQQIFADHPDVMRKHHFDPACRGKLHHESGIEIDFWKDDFSDQIAARARTMAFYDRVMRIAEVHDLLALSLRANRPQDDYDISEIIRKTPVDESLLSQRVTPEEFARYQAIKARVGA